MRVTITPDPKPRDSRFRRKIVSSVKLPQFKNGHKVKLECGHEVIIFGDISLAEGVALCDFCRGVTK